MISMLLSLLAVGVLAYLLLHHTGTSSDTTGAQAVSCEQRINKIVQDTGGIGSQAKAAYDALPRECQRFMPDPTALTPRMPATEAAPVEAPMTTTQRLPQTPSIPEPAPPPPDAQ